jgi:hypothetical protein
MGHRSTGYYSLHGIIPCFIARHLLGRHKEFFGTHNKVIFEIVKGLSAPEKDKVTGRTGTVAYR